MNAKVPVFKRVNAPRVSDEQRQDVVKREVVSILYSALKILTNHPDKICISVIQGEQTTIFEIDFCQEDFGKVLGTRGRNISALRTVVNSICGFHNFRAVVRIKDEERFALRREEL